MVYTITYFKKMNEKNIFITGIGTGVGKTIVSAVLASYWKADYWKPIQCGDLDNTDSERVKHLVNAESTHIHQERFRLQLAASPHEAAAAENIAIHPDDFQPPFTANRLIIEGAGGLLVPLSGDFFMIDLIKQLGATAVLVIRDYLGCINHSLLSYEVLRRKEVRIRALVFNGNMNKASQEAIESHVSEEIPIIHVPELSLINNEAIRYSSLHLSINSKIKKNESAK
uniref:ATP-dependent dethiobiotin synthetase BioD n=1 Tax=Sphingobacterium sp. (strain 21) TaxID=743722 RepID=F4C5P6_SPHS2